MIPFLGNNVAPSMAFQFAEASALPSNITFTRGTAATYFDSTGTLQTAASGAARFDYNPTTLAARGLLIEESRTNSIRNNTMQGAVAGTPGTLPTNWDGLGSEQGLTRTIVGTGIDNGIPYIDVKWAGTLTSALSDTILVNAEPPPGVTAANGQSWAGSWFVKLVGGSTANFSSLIIQITERTAAGAFVASGSAAFTPTANPLSQQRLTIARTLAGGATVERVTCELRGNAPTSSAIDITLRIGLPQLEQGAFATSVIPTTNAAATRNADVATVTLGSWFNASEGTLFAEYDSSVNTVSGVARRLFHFSNGTDNNRIYIAWGDTTARALFVVTAGGIAQASISGLAMQASGGRVAGAYRLDDFAVGADGTLVGADTSGSVPTVTTAHLGSGATVSANQFLNGCLRRVAYYPRRLPDAYLQSLTA